jgi:AhpD family alkylhydroperoxidase
MRSWHPSQKRAVDVKSNKRFGVSRVRGVTGAAKELLMSKLPQTYLGFKKAHSKVWRAYDRLGAAAAQEGPLDQKTRELVKLGMAAASKSESAVRSHTHRALEAGVSGAEIEHALILGVTTLGFPAMMAALAWARDAIAAHQAQAM